MHLTDKGRDLIQSFEGCKLQAYQDSGGVWTIGWGHTSAAGAPRVYSGMVISQAEADAIFLRDVADTITAVKRALGDAPTTPAQFDAFVSLTYNIGSGNFQKSTALRRHKVGDYAGAAEAITWWNRVGQNVSRGLVRRREAERAHYMSDLPTTDTAAETERPGRPTGGEQKPIAKSATAQLGASGAALSALAAAAKEGEQFLTDFPALSVLAGKALPYIAFGIFTAIIAVRLREWWRGEH